MKYPINILSHNKLFKTFIQNKFFKFKKDKQNHVLVSKILKYIKYVLMFN